MNKDNVVLIIKLEYCSVLNKWVDSLIGVLT